MIDLDAIEKGEMYRELKESIIIFICRFDAFGRGMSRYTFENICIEDKGIRLGDGSSKVFFNTRAYEKEEREEVRIFLEYVERDVARGGGFIGRIDRRVREIKENKEWRAEYMNLMMKEREIAQENFEKGVAKGREEGKAEGIEEGIDKGKAEGKLEGIEEGIRKLVESLREFGVDEKEIRVKVISKYGLREEELDKYLK